MHHGSFERQWGLRVDLELDRRAFFRTGRFHRWFGPPSGPARSQYSPLVLPFIPFFAPQPPHKEPAISVSLRHRDYTIDELFIVGISVEPHTEATCGRTHSCTPAAVAKMLKPFPWLPQLMTKSSASWCQACDDGVRRPRRQAIPKNWLGFGERRPMRGRCGPVKAFFFRSHVVDIYVTR
ncbi:hypothetical protein BD310DRAFT_601187 [Dichomitus squalens]|uniref:Uncharacterized protein n=1 Tax=Dichomitus squalens TaxID=114155 RepID=A0A4Q9PR14_9APHY|nr:hypothetical protein BD310DRAFT_601187 [Dichomitus squalens]